MRKNHMKSRLLWTSTLSMVAAFTLAACANDGADSAGMNEDDSETEAAAEENTEQNGEQSVLATADIADGEGESLGQVEFIDAEQGTEVNVEAENMEPGFYGFHIHEVGECEPDSQAPDDPEDTGDFMWLFGIEGVDGVLDLGVLSA